MHGSSTRRVSEAEIETLYRVHGVKLRAFIRRHVQDRETAADLVQEVFMKILRSPMEVRSDGEMRSYLYRAAVSAIAAHHGRARKFVHLTQDDDAAHRVSTPPMSRALDVERALARLPRRDRTLLWLAYIEEMNHAEIGSAVGVARASVKVLLFRARRRFGEALRALGLAPENI